MPFFSPYTIHHLQLDGLDSVTLPAAHHYLVIWQGRIPLGHCWLELDKGPASLADYRETIAAAIRPALEYYRTASPGASAAPAGLSVIICTRNRPKDLERCVRTLLDSSDKDFELIVVDNASDDDQTAQVLKNFPSVRYVKEDRKGLDIARNTGARAASHPLLAYTDDDVQVDRDWTRHIKTSFEDPLVMAVTGLVIPELLKTRSQYTFERYWGFNKGYLPKTFDHRYFLDHLSHGVPAWDIGAGANMAFRREVFDLVGWFDERLDVGASGCSGDSEFWYRILAEGWNCRYLPHIFVYHRHRESDAGLSKQLFYYMRGHVSALLVQYERYGNKGELRRLRKGLPQYYWNRIKERFGLSRPPGRNRPLHENFNTLLTEIKGCLSGWRFYHSVKTPSPAPLIIPDEDPLRRKAVITGGTLVSVIIPSYNHAHYLPAAIQTILDQTYKNTEIVVVDDGSTDHTEALCRQYEKLRYVRTERVGPSAARNIGVLHSRGDFLVFLDADDLLYPNAIELNLYYFGLYPDIAFVSGAHDRIDDQGNYLPGNEAIVRLGENYRSLLQGNYIAMEATVLYRRELFFRFHFDPSVIACEDYDLNLRITRHLPVFGHATKLAAYRIHGGNRSKDEKMMLHSALAVLRQQEKGLLNEEEKAAWRLGIKNWEGYYSKTLQTNG
jgi:glycosyltransferase involved in cell wall biosynthesis